MIGELSVRKLSLSLQNGDVTAEQVFNYYSGKKDDFGAFLHKNDIACSVACDIDKRRANGEKLNPLAGVPIAIKDNICTKDMPTTCASKTLEGFVSPYNATVIEKINSLGMPIIGKTNMDEFAMGSSGENSAYFKTINPINQELSPGGSSSGSAAAVAGGLAPIALGTDTGGSIRLPAAMCKICGFKPSYGAISRYGLIAFASSLDQIGILSKDVDDAEVLFNELVGRDARDMTSIEIERKEIPNPKVGYFIKNGLKFNANEVHLSLFDYLLPIYYIISSAEASSNLARYDGIRYGKDSEFGDEVKRRIALGDFVLSAENIGEYYNRACRARALIIKEMLNLFNEFDFIVMPTLIDKPLKVNAKINPCDMYAQDAYTVLANLAYLPAISLPIGEQSVTILARRGNDHALLSFAKEVWCNEI